MIEQESEFVIDNRCRLFFDAQQPKKASESSCISIARW